MPELRRHAGTPAPDGRESGVVRILRQAAHVADEPGAIGAAPDVRALERLLDLRQLPVEPERRPHAGTLALCCKDGSHADWDAHLTGELATNRNARYHCVSASAPATISRISCVICA